jgi:AAA domain
METITTNFKAEKETINCFTRNGIIFYYLKLKELKKKNQDICYNINSPFRKDRKPSFNVYRVKSTNAWHFKDYGDEGSQGDVFAFAGLIYDLSPKTQFREILIHMYQDLKIDSFNKDEVSKLLNGERAEITYTHLIGERKPSYTSSYTNVIGCKCEFFLYEQSYGELGTKEKAFIEKYSFDIGLLKQLGVAFINGYRCRYSTDDPWKYKTKDTAQIWIAYKFSGGVKIYCPNPKKFWYLGSCNKNYCFGTPCITEVMEGDKFVFLVGGEKDVLTLMSRGYEAMCLSSETKSVAKQQVKDWYQYHHYKVAILYDNDATGVKQANKLSEQFHFYNIQLPKWLNEKGGKDISDYFVLGGTIEEFDQTVAQYTKAIPAILLGDVSDKRLSIRTATQRLEDARNQVDILPHFDVFFQYNELAILFGDTGKGKSILAVSIANAISKGESFLGLENAYPAQCVLYYDFELSDKQFQKRYSNDLGEMYPFNSNFFIDNMDFTDILPKTKNEKFEDNLVEKIKTDIQETEAKIVVIDNMTFLSTQSAEDSQVALNLMRKLKELKTEAGISVLVLAHTPKRTNPMGITIQDLAGSKHISNFADNVFALGQSNKDKDLRYLIQVKPSRSGELKYDKSNVILCEIEKQDNYLTFHPKGNAVEYELLRSGDSDNEDDLIDHAKELKAKGMSYRNIADELGVSKSKVGRWLKH